MGFCGFYLWKFLRRVSNDLESCWNQVADLDAYCAKIKDTADEHYTLALKQWSMMQDYQEEIHHGLVEAGGFVKRMMGLTMEQQGAMNRLESANLVAFNAMGADSYLRLVRQRASAH